MSFITLFTTSCILCFFLSSAIPAHARSVTLTARSCRRKRCRTLSGRCTSAGNPAWAGPGIPFQSYLRNHTAAVPRGQDLKSARVISNILSAQSRDTVNAHGLNEFWTWFNLFVAHDLILSPDSDEAFDIPVPPDDPFLPPGTRMPFFRSERIRTGEGDNERPQNTVSSALDLSGVYGIDSKRNAAVRRPGSAKLLTSPGNLLPLNTAGLPNIPDNSSNFYLAGDTRANETPLLLILHNLFVREHNRLVDEIRSHIPFLSKNKLYEYARKINIAQFQKIVFEEFYPAISSLPLPPYRGHNPKTNPSITDVFAGAGAGIGINMLGATVPRISADGRSLPAITLEEMVFRNATKDPITEAEISNYLRGAVTTVAQENDLQVQDGFRNIVTKTSFGTIGLDLFGNTIQRGRDIALPTFNELRKAFGTRKLSIRSISSDPKVVAGLNAAYDGNADDIDLWSGLLAEDRMPGSGLGETMGIVWREELTRFRDGDQFFYRRWVKMPKVLRRKLRQRLRDLRNKKSLLRMLIIRNTEVTDEQLPRGNIFRV